MNTPKIALAALACLLAYGVSPVRADVKSLEVVDVQAPKIEDAYVLEADLPRYPESMLLSGKQGRTLLKLRVMETGEVSSIRVVASTSKAFSEAAVRSVKHWYFEPGKREGVPIAQTVMVPVEFIIEDLAGRSLASL